MLFNILSHSVASSFFALVMNDGDSHHTFSAINNCQYCWATEDILDCVVGPYIALPICGSANAIEWAIVVGCLSGDEAETM